eukprot:5587687-Ditylum_brightwellii.AAC.1
MCNTKPEGETKSGAEITLMEIKPEGKTKMGVETVMQGNAQGKAKVTRSEVTAKVNKGNAQVKMKVSDKASMQALDEVIAVTNEPQYKQVMSRNDIIMQVKKVEITTKSDNTEIE